MDHTNSRNLKNRMTAPDSPKEDESSDAVFLFQNGYMRKKNIKKILKEEVQDGNRTDGSED